MSKVYLKSDTDHALLVSLTKLRLERFCKLSAFISTYTVLGHAIFTSLVGTSLIWASAEFDFLSLFLHIDLRTSFGQQDICVDFFGGLTKNVTQSSYF